MNQDLSSSFIDEDTLLYVRNGILFNHEGEYLTIQNEQSNKLICTLPYPMIGYTSLPDGNWCLFLSDDIHSEIGILTEKTYIYTTKLNAEWLNFSRHSLITSASKENEDGTFSIYWADKRRNPDRTLNLSQFSKATYDSIRLAPLVTPPILNIKKSTGGVLPNGSYQAVIKYSVKGKAFGNAYSLTLPVSIFSDNLNSGALNITVDNLDNDFQEYQLFLIQNTNSTETIKSLGFYPAKTKSVHITNFDKPEYLPVKSEDIVIENTVWIASDKIDSNNEYLFRIGTETIPELNYQRQALDIKVQYTVTRAPSDYYSYGSEVGYYRDEAYLPFIQFLHKTGAWSSAFPIGARKPTSQETSIASGNDVYEGLIKTCDEPVVKKRWEVENTASPMVKLPADPSLVCDIQLVGYGDMAYYESTDTYPDNPVYGEWANQPIIVPKFPDEERCPRYSTIDGKTYINILGWQFSNIQHPLTSDGKPDPEWVGYRIIRADRSGNKSVISRGLLTNVRSYQEKQGSEDVTVMYQNYPINDLRPDSFISSKQTYYKKSRERDFKPLTDYYMDRFNFYSPHSIIGRYSLGPEIKIESEEIADVDGEFTPVYNHPKEKLLSLFTFWLAAAVGSAEALLTTLGKNDYYSESDLETDVSLTGGVKKTNKMGKTTKISSVEDLIGLDIVSFVKDNILAGKLDAFTIVKNVLLAITSIGLKALTFTFYGIQAANQIISVIDNFAGYTNYTLQYNCHAYFNKSQPITTGYKRRFVNNYQYLEPGLQTIAGQLFNNNLSSPSVYVELNQSLSPFKNRDNSRQTMTEFGTGEDFTQKTKSTAVAYYATSKVPNPNQYGRVESNTRFLITHNNYFPVTPTSVHDKYSTGPIYGGDCYIVRYTQQKKFQFFTQNLANTNAPDGEEFDYKLYRNIGYPRFWANFFKYDFSELISKDVGDFSNFSNTVISRHNLDNKGKDDVNVFTVDNAYFYLSNNGVLDFFVESDYNLEYREKPKSDTFFYSKKFSTLSQIFRSDRLSKPEEFNYDQSLSKQADQIFAQIQPTYYDPAVYDSQYKYNKNRLIYSLPSYGENRYDAWRYFLSGNQYTFSLSEFGSLVSLHRMDRDRILLLFDRASPAILTGRNFLEISDRTVSIGDQGLFAQPPTEIMHTETHYGSCQSSFASSSTPYGAFYVSEREGRLFNFSSNLDDLSRNGMQMWSKQYFPIQLTQYFPDFKDSDNPVIGVGYNISVDTAWDVVYVSKRDYIPKEGTTYDATKNVFLSPDLYSVTLGDPDYFDDVSFTLSYSPTLKAFISYHDWVPDLSIPLQNHFLTSKDSSLYLHNSNPLSYCNYYNKQYPFELEYSVSNKMQVESLQSLEYYLECYRFKDDGRNKYHVLNENFDHLIIRNSEQISPFYTLIQSTGKPLTDMSFPKKNQTGYDILYSKVENKYRVDQFWDSVRDRLSDRHLLHIQANGYHRFINPEAIDLNKPKKERKLFRHYQNSISLIKENPDNLLMLLRLSLAKQQISQR